MGGVIKFTCNEGTTWINPYNNLTYQMPDQIWSIVSKPTSVMEIEKTVYRSMFDVRKERLGQFRAKVGGFWRTSASASYSNKRLIHELMVEDNIVTKAEAFVSTVDAVLASPNILGLSEEVMAVIDSLPDDFDSNPEPYFDFIDYFGTHYISTAEFGGYIQMFFSTSKNFESASSNYQLSVEAQASFFNFFSASGVWTNSERSNSQSYLDSTNTKVTYHGGHTNLLDNKDLQGWEKSVPLNPWLYSGNLIPIYKLISDDTKRHFLKQAYKKYILSGGQSYLEEMNEQLKKAAEKYQFVTNTTLIESLQKRAQKLMLYENPNATDIEELGQKANFHLVPSEWWSKTKLCLHTQRKYYSHGNCQDDKPFCTVGFHYSNFYYDYTQNSWTTYCGMRWGIFTPFYADEWFKSIQICFKYNCPSYNHEGEFCAPVNNYTEQYWDQFSHSGGCQMSWMLKTESSNLPFWFQNTKLCAFFTKQSGECARTDYHTPVCAAHNEWTAIVTDNSRDNSYGCGYQWAIKEILN
ncbi:perivitellin-2 67 kDa subunit-like [Convolutriloba macropyga]|uniref:perivitellin-2 67 kDa subunit-like n=1 Tax=Convolutriloba macropyga TaxID=536237 RepID=UPI003F51EDDF